MFANSIKNVAWFEEKSIENSPNPSFTRDIETLTEETSVWTPHAKSLLYVRQPPDCLVYMCIRRGSILSGPCCSLGHVCFIFNAWPGT